MNYTVLFIGLFGSLFVLMFVLIALADGVKTAAIVISCTLLSLLAAGGLVAFWFWVAAEVA